MTTGSDACRNLEAGGAAPRGDAAQGHTEERHTLMPASPSDEPTKMESLSHDGETGKNLEREEGSKEGTDEEKDEEEKCE